MKVKADGDILHRGRLDGWRGGTRGQGREIITQIEGRVIGGGEGDKAYNFTPRRAEWRRRKDKERGRKGVADERSG